MMATAPQPTPLYDALSKVTVGGVNIAHTGSSRFDAINELLQQAHALTVIFGAALEDAAAIEGVEGIESALDTTRSHIKANAISGLGTLIGLAAALSAEG